MPVMSENRALLPLALDRADPVPHRGELADYDRQDQELLIALRAGSSAAFEELQKRNAKRLYKRILSITRNREDAEDALQDTFMRAFLGLDSFQGRSHLSTWLTRIAINSALMITRRRRRAYAEVSLTSSSESETDFDVCDSAPTPEQICDLKQRSDRMYSAVGRLDATSRAVIGIQITQERSMKEIAHVLDISVANVKARLHRARKKLAKYVNHRGRRSASQKHADSNPGLRIEQNYA